MFVPLAIVAVLLALWASLAPISGAVIAAARIKVELERKTVQHREGGIVREIKVRNGQQVRAGDVLVVVDDVRSDAELSLLEDQLRAERVRHARVNAETTLARQFNDQPFAADPRMAEHVERERAQFEARRRTLDEQLDALQMQMGAARAQSAALRKPDRIDSRIRPSRRRRTRAQREAREGRLRAARAPAAIAARRRRCAQPPG